MFHRYSYLNMFSNPAITVLTIVLFILWGLTFYITFNFNRKVKLFSNNTTKYTGLELAKKMLEDNYIYDVKIEVKENKLGSEYYDPRKKLIVLSNECAYSNSISANSIAAHEIGHAIQHNVNYGFMRLRNVTAKPLSIITNVGIGLSIVVGIASFFTGSSMLYLYIILAVSVLSLIFQLITLPVEFDASSRALGYLSSTIYTDQIEINQSKQVLQAAALTYIVSTLVALVTVLRLLAILMSSNSRD